MNRSDNGTHNTSSSRTPGSSRRPSSRGYNREATPSSNSQERNSRGGSSEPPEYLSPAEKRASRGIAYPSARSSNRPSSSGRIPRQHAASTRATHPHPSSPRGRAGQRTARNEAYSERSFPDPPEHDTYRNRSRNLRVEKKHPSIQKRLIAVGAGIAVVAAVGFGAFSFIQNLPAQITLNGSSLEVRGGKTLDDALAASGIKPRPGDLIAVDGSVIEQGKGEPFNAVVNGEKVSDSTTKIASGDVVEIGNGNPIEEPSKTTDEVIPFSVEEVGRGAIRLVEGTGADGVKSTKVGDISGITAEVVTQEPSNIVRRNVSPQVGNDKVIALTFDDGPWKDQTVAVLDILAQHGAKATFFTVGNRIEGGNGAELVKRAFDEGHQICSHSYDHASGSGQSVNLGYMTPEEQIAEVEKGLAAIEAATGAPASRVFRTPGGNYGPEVFRTIGSMITAEIGWNIDSGDWRKSGPASISREIESAWPGAIVLLHDGGGDRSQTVEALRTSLPRLKEQGYKFITLDELLAYPTE